MIVAIVRSQGALTGMVQQVLRPPGGQRYRTDTGLIQTANRDDRRTGDENLNALPSGGG